MTTIALITDLKQPGLTRSDRLLVAPLQARGVTAVPVPWDAPHVDWHAYDALVLRSCWEYHHQAAHFQSWVEWLREQHIPLWNPAPVVLWNMDKHYLRHLADRNVPIVPTVWLAQGDAPDLAAVLDSRGWTQAVVKPCISASAHDTWRTTRAAAAQNQQRFTTMLAGQSLMVQKLMPEIEQGEWSLIFLAGAYSHAILKRPAVGDIFVQEHLGGSSVGANAGKGIIKQAANILRQAELHTGHAVLYARVDGVLVNGRLTLMELELIEPDLFLAEDPLAASRFAQAITTAVAAGL